MASEVSTITWSSTPTAATSLLVLDPAPDFVPTPVPADNFLDQLVIEKLNRDILKVLESAIANAEHNHNADIDELKVWRVEVDTAPVLKRFHARAKGRGNRIVKRNSHITIYVADAAK